MARSHFQGLVGFLLRDWFAFLLRLVFYLDGQGQIWLWFQGQNMFLSLTLFSCMVLISGPGHVSSTSSDSRANVCIFFDFSYRVKVCFLGSGQGVFLWLAPFPYRVLREHRAE